jgi:hypothetical protein
MRFPLLLAALFSLPLSSVATAAWTLDVESGAAFATKADVQVPNNSLGTLFSMPDDLGEADAVAFFRGRLTWEINDRHVISALYAPLSFDFAGTSGQRIDFAGQSFAAGTPLAGSYQFNSYRLSYRYNFIRRENLTFGLGLTAKVRDAEITLSGDGRTAVDDNVGVVPLLNFWLDWRMAPRWHLLFNGDAAGSSQGRAEDIALAVKYDATERLGLSIGYRLLEGGADGDEVKTFALFHYATVGMSYRF